MLETRIAELTAAVASLTKAIGGVQAGLPVQAPMSAQASYEAVKREHAEAQRLTPEQQADVAKHEAQAPNAKPETPKSPPTTDTSQTSSSESVAVTYDDVKRATNAVSKISRDKAIAGLARFGVSSATKLTEQQWPEYVAYMTKVAAGELDPEASHE